MRTNTLTLPRIKKILKVENSHVGTTGGIAGGGTTGGGTGGGMKPMWKKKPPPKNSTRKITCFKSKISIATSEIPHS